MPNPLSETLAFLQSDAPNLPADTTYNTRVPDAAITVPHVQFDWDGTPDDADNREDAAIRVTVWSPRGRVTDCQDIAAGLRARFLRYSSAFVWRVDRGAGRAPGVDPDTELPFCTFTVNVVMHAVSA